MKQLRLTIMKMSMLAVSALALLNFAACGVIGGGGGGGGGGVADVPLGTGTVGQNTTAASCQVGQIWSQQYGCLSRYSCDSGFGWLASENKCVPGTLVTEEMKYGGTAIQRFFGSIAVSNHQTFQNLFKYAHLCDFMWTGWNWGSWRCDYWTNRGGFMEIKFFSSTTSGGQKLANMFIGAGTSNPSNWNANWYYSYQGSQTYIGFSQAGRVDPINNSAGLSVVGLDPHGIDVGLRAEVENGSPTQNSLRFTLRYQGTVFGTVTAQKY